MLHKLIGLGDRHAVHNWEYADAAARLAATGFVSTDVKSLALQLDTHSLWMLTATTPTWVQVAGSSAPASSSTMVAGEILGGHRVVTVNGSGAAVYATSAGTLNANRVVGITLGAAILGGAVDVQYAGDITEPTWNWTLGLPIYLGLTGLLTQTPPSSPSNTFSQVVAFPATPTRIIVDLREPITLA